MNNKYNDMEKSHRHKDKKNKPDIKELIMYNSKVKTDKINL